MLLQVIRDLVELFRTLLGEEEFLDLFLVEGALVAFFLQVRIDDLEFHGATECWIRL